MPLSRIGWIRPITEEYFNDFAKNPSGSIQKTNLRGYVAHRVVDVGKGCFPIGFSGIRI